MLGLLPRIAAVGEDDSKGRECDAARENNGSAQDFEETTGRLTCKRIEEENGSADDTHDGVGANDGPD